MLKTLLLIQQYPELARYDVKNFDGTNELILQEIRENYGESAAQEVEDHIFAKFFDTVNGWKSEWWFFDFNTGDNGYDISVRDPDFVKPTDVIDFQNDAQFLAFCPDDFATNNF